MVSIRTPDNRQLLPVYIQLYILETKYLIKIPRNDTVDVVYRLLQTRGAPYPNRISDSSAYRVSAIS
jgi:hypothetical protein